MDKSERCVRLQDDQGNVGVRLAEVADAAFLPSYTYRLY